MVERIENINLNIGAARSDDKSEDSASICLQNGDSATYSPYEKIDSSTNSAHEGHICFLCPRCLITPMLLRLYGFVYL